MCIRLQDSGCKLVGEGVHFVVHSGFFISFTPNPPWFLKVSVTFVMGPTPTALETEGLYAHNRQMGLGKWARMDHL